PHLSAAFFPRKAQLYQMRRALHLRHLRRLQSGMSPSIESSAIHIDLLIALRNVLSHVSTIAHVVQEDLSVGYESDEERSSSGSFTGSLEEDMREQQEEKLDL